MSENDNNFDALRHLLALKRHEIPPPGYFENFSGNVMARIRAGGATQELPWLLRFLQAFEAKPAYPVALASSLCVLLLFGIVNVEQNPGIASVWGPVSSPTANTNPTLIALVDTNSASDQSLFNAQPNPLFKQESFTVGN